MIWLKQSTAVVVSFGPFVDKTDGVTLETGLVSSLDHASTGIFLSKNGGTLTIRHATVTASSYDAYGNYKVTLDTTDTNTLGTLRMQFSEAATCLPVWQDFMVVPSQVWDSYFGADLLQVDAQQFGNTNGTFSSGRPEVNTTHIAGSAVSTSSAQIGVNVVNAAGTAWGSGAITAASIAADAITAAKIADGAIDAATFAANAITATAIAADAITDAKVASDVTIASVTGAVGSVTGAVGSVTGNVGGNVTGSVGSVVGAVGSVTGNVGGNVVGSVGSVTGLTASNLDATISSRLATAGYTAPDNSSITAIKAKTDSLTYTVANVLDANIQRVNDVVVTGDGQAGTEWGP